MIKYPGTVLCPSCGGDGRELIACGDGYALCCCATCNGKRIVYPVKREITEYTPI